MLQLILITSDLIVGGAVCSKSSARLGLSSKKGVSPAEVRQCASYCFQLMLNANWVQADLYIKFADKAADKQ